MNLRFALLLALCPVALWAEPVYLDCRVSGEKPFSVKLDEASGKVTHTASSYYAFNVDGFFTAHSIAYQQVTKIGDSMRSVVRYEIDRTTLAAKQIVMLQGVIRGTEQKPSVSNGECHIAKVTGRKI